MLKKELRLHYSQSRAALSFETLTKYSLQIANRLLDLPIWSMECYHIFLSIEEKKEIDTSFILAILNGKDKNVVLPKMAENNSLTHYLLTDNTVLKKNRWNVPEPVDALQVPVDKIDVVFVPLLAFDVFGNRVGYGKGYYDAFLKNCKPEVVKIGLSLFNPAEKIEDLGETDVPLDYCVTPEKTYRF